MNLVSRIDRRVLLLAVFALVVVAALYSEATAVSAASFSFNTDVVLDNAASFFNGIWPIVGVVVAIPFAIGLVKMLSRMFSNMFG